MHVAVQEVSFVGSDLFFICSPVQENCKTLSILLKSPQKIEIEITTKNFTLRFDSELIVSALDQRLYTHLYHNLEFYNQQLSLFHFDILTTQLSIIVRVHCLLLL